MPKIENVAGEITTAEPLNVKVKPDDLERRAIELGTSLGEAIASVAIDDGEDGTYVAGVKLEDDEL